MSAEATPDAADETEPKIYATTTRSDTAYSVNVSSTHPYQSSMTIWELRDFLRAIDAAGIPDSAELSCEHMHDTCRFVGVRVHHTFTVEGAPDA